jgi:hypothetical protein
VRGSLFLASPVFPHVSRVTGDARPRGRIGSMAHLSPASRRRAAVVPALLAGLTVARMLRADAAGSAGPFWPWAVLLVVAVAAVVFLLWPGAARRP